MRDEGDNLEIIVWKYMKNSYSYKGNRRTLKKLVHELSVSVENSFHLSNKWRKGDKR